ncbi:uncharacterized protein Z519_11746 [Cladophialophora bantiana CBS 173.52]|uniref:Major facilitator superfamily (MFS) profile domain-containing protein n=1 Tax=Cladophialophora bantiana (strain ATCC 10958 / CBS 173.52 / CDC B-1940 / NIH 8579) TaxID=1442370 RepID=A0A0D2FM22_CLAB1|nr:uncharacterized protein Z519_11746 [Cladophialophora bantiana CBS 173.52]KIW87772.1 hypothetical protein Z519_11746 [Cladophialophora bantiana CBS 173.52]
MWTVFKLDHATIYNYQIYAASDFEQIALSGHLMTVGTIVSAVLKPPLAQISDVIGPAETYIGVIVCYVISYALCVSARGFGQYIGGYIINNVGQTGMQILNQIIVADITSSRCRGLANGLVSLPFTIIPWFSAFIVDSALVHIGWRWGIAMFSIIMLACSLSVVSPLVWFQRRLERAGGCVRTKTSICGFGSQIDFGGMLLLSGGCGMLLLPTALAENAKSRWTTPWVPTLMAIGVAGLTLLIYYESRIATKPATPPRLFENISLPLAFLIRLVDGLCLQRHTHLPVCLGNSGSRTCVTRCHVSDDTAGCVQVLIGLGTGFLMYRSKRYKWLLLVGIVIRLIGYGFMMRLRVIQGAGSGAVGTIVIVVAQIVVPRAELAYSTALELLRIYLGNSAGSAVVGTIYTNLIKEQLRFWMGLDASQAAINSIYGSITAVVPRPGTSDRNAINHAYSDILRSMTIVALVASAIPMVLIWFLSNLELNDKHNLAGNSPETGESDAQPDLADETRPRKWKRRMCW